MFLDLVEGMHLFPRTASSGPSHENCPRLCPGRLLAMNSLFIMMSYMLASFDIAKDTDADGTEIPIQPKYRDGLIRYVSSSATRGCVPN